MDTETKLIHELLEEVSDRLKPIADLYEWSLNYDYQTGTPYGLFLDVIGWSDEQYGGKIAGEFVLDYDSADSFAEALKVWAIRPQDVYEFIDELNNAE